MKDKKNLLAIINLNYSGLEVVLCYFYFLKKKNYNFTIALGEFSLLEKLKNDSVNNEIIKDLDIKLITGNFKSENTIKFFIFNKLSFFLPKKFYFIFFYNFSLISILKIFFKSDCIFHEYGNDLKYTGIIDFISIFNKKKIYLYNSATAPEFFLEYNPSINGKIDIRKKSTFLLYDENVRSVYEKIGFENFFETGYHRYNKDWIDYKINKCDEYYKINKKIIVIFSKNFDDKNIPKNLRIEIFSKIIKLIKKYYSYDIFIKPHPRDNLKILKLIEKMFEKVNVTNLDSMYLIKNSDLTISLSSSIIFDALILKRNHLDFYVKQAMRHQASGSRWSKLGILSTSSFDELETIVRDKKFTFNESLIKSLPSTKLPIF